MTHPVVELKKRFERGRSTSGTVIELVGESTAIVSTRYGVKSLDIPVGLQLVAGDRVRVESENITGKLKSEAQIPVFRI